MAVDKKISELPVASTLVGTEPLPIVQSGETRKVTITEVLGFITGSNLNFGGELVISSAGGLYIKSNGLSGTPGATFFKMNIDDFGEIVRPLESTGFSSAQDLIDSL